MTYSLRNVNALNTYVSVTVFLITVIVSVKCILIFFADDHRDFTLERVSNFKKLPKICTKDNYTSFRAIATLSRKRE